MTCYLSLLSNILGISSMQDLQICRCQSNRCDLPGLVPSYHFIFHSGIIAIYNSINILLLSFLTLATILILVSLRNWKIYIKQKKGATKEMYQFKTKQNASKLLCSLLINRFPLGELPRSSCFYLTITLLFHCSLTLLKKLQYPT